VLFEDKNYIIEDAKGIKAFKVQMKGKSFVLDFMNEEHTDVYKEKNNLMLWHKRMRHYHHEALFFMKKNNMVKGLTKLEKDSPTVLPVMLVNMKNYQDFLLTKQGLKSHTKATIDTHKC
jgi:hypothetical protein